MPQKRAAPLSVEIVDGVLTGKAALPLSDEQHEKLARDGWQALKAFRDTFGAAFDLHNHGQLQAFLGAFDQAMGEAYDPDKVVLIGSIGSGIADLSKDKEFCDCLPTGAAPLLQQFAVQI